MKTLLNLVHSELEKGVVLTAQENSTILGLIPTIDTNGAMSYSYNVVDSLRDDVAFREIGEQYEGSYSISELKTETLKILSADVKIDRIFTDGIIGNANDVLVEQTTQATISIADKFEKNFFYGADSKGFKGLETRIADGIGKQFEGALSMDLLDEVLDHVRYTKGDIVLAMNAKTRRQLTKLMRESNVTTNNVDLFGKSVTKYDEVVILVSEAVKDGELFAINFNEILGVSMLTSKGVQVNEQGYRGTQKVTAVELVSAIKTSHPRCFAQLKISSARALKR